ncbi:exodeoxyribonuclease V subunit alpha [Saccharospirillum salsuginis]|uniref:RecBCD enzyme subunit RecD n=1 Tax=Saccharospirillum salsuginis TaxID=418750 RepID=A0A918K517_9GAMM|nr:exodeoxyribonuclease V subunit alpha [Saccharospirillum salsuginis]GGX49809.1 RecBCD enzyme subunit RecD [Saccharospirillum salsuginis]
MRDLLSLRQTLEDVAEVDLFLAERLCAWLHCDEDWLFYSLVGVSHALRQGHSCLLLSAWAGRTEWAVDDQPDSGYRFPALDDWHARLSSLPIGPDEDAPVVYEHQRLYLRRYWRFECDLAEGLRLRLDAPTQPNLKAAREALATLFDLGGNHTDWQAVAAANALFNRFSIIAGGPGTGKTYTVTRVLALLAMTLPDAPTIRMAAPTGKAAQRLGESIRAAKSDLGGRVDLVTLDAIPDEATTLHRLLGVIPNQPGFRHDARNPLDIDILLMDEVSMVDLPLMARLFRTLPAHCRVILLGDADQLPSVAAGSVLADLAERPHPGYSPTRTKALKQFGFTVDASGKNPGPADYLSYLYHSRRFDGEGGIGRLARQVIEGDADGSLNTLIAGHNDLEWVPTERIQNRISRWVEDWYRPIAHSLDRAAAFDALFQFRLLCPTRVGPLGVEALNERILKMLNPGRAPFFKGQPIMITENHYGVGLYNGDIGLIWPDDEGQLLAWFQTGEEHRPVAPGRLPRFETVYAMTIHKTQGSEFERVAIILPETPMAMLSRELIYTGLTRARQSLAIAGSEPVWRDGVKRRVERFSGLQKRLVGDQRN